jgi:glycosyltransferase involved in cell wall biosynthesis
MALGKPVIASPVGVNLDIIADGVNGFLAAEGNQWCETIARLIRDPELRARTGEAGRQTVESRYALSVHAPRLAEALAAIHQG